MALLKVPVRPSFLLLEKLTGWFEFEEPTLVLPLSQDWRLARIWLSMADTHESLSSRVWASKCQVCPVKDTMMKSAFSSSVRDNRGEQSQMRFAGVHKQLMSVRDGEQKAKEERSDEDDNRNSSSSLLPVLLMFLKLPKLFNFHILRLAAERDKQRRRQTRVEKTEGSSVSC